MRRNNIKTTYHFFFKVGEFIVNDIIVYQPYSSNQTEISLSIFVQRSFVKMFSTTYLPTFCLLILVQMTFYFPEDNFQVRATVALSCLLILSSMQLFLQFTHFFFLFKLWSFFLQLCLEVPHEVYQQPLLLLSLRFG